MFARGLCPPGECLNETLAVETIHVARKRGTRPVFSPNRDYASDANWRFTAEEVSLILAGTSNYRRQLISNQRNGQSSSVSVAEITSELLQSGGQYARLVKNLNARPFGFKWLADRVRYQLKREGFCRSKD
jgi:hypothetical protein